MNSIVAEKRIHLFGLPILVIALSLFYMLGAAALLASAVRSGELASIHGARALVVPAVVGDAT
jgi:hypothetical protein